MSKFGNLIALVFAGIILTVALLVVVMPSSRKLPEHDVVAFLQDNGALPKNGEMGLTTVIDRRPLRTTCYEVRWSRGFEEMHKELICAPINGVFPRADVKDTKKD